MEISHIDWVMGGAIVFVFATILVFYGKKKGEKVLSQLGIFINIISIIVTAISIIMNNISIDAPQKIMNEETNTKTLTTNNSNKENENSSLLSETQKETDFPSRNKLAIDNQESPIRQIVLEVAPEELTVDSAYQEGKRAAQNGNYAKAEKYYKSSADRGMVKAAYEFANLLWLDGDGEVKNYDCAFEYMKKAADENYSKAFRPLGEMYHGGRGVSKDMNKAVYWYKRAADLGDEKAKYLLNNTKLL